MKKIISILLLACTLALCLASCGDGGIADGTTATTTIKKTNAEKVEEKIEAIADADSAYEAAKAYYALTKEEKKAVRNRDYLPYNIKEYISDTRVRDYYMQWMAEDKFVSFHKSLRNGLLNPTSYTVNDQVSKVFFDANTGNYYLYIKVDYSAQNKLGGYVRYENANYFVWEGDYWRELRASFGTDGEMDIIKAIYTWQYSEYKNYNFKYSAE